jgi:hypothetical protein
VSGLNRACGKDERWPTLPDRAIRIRKWYLDYIPRLKGPHKLSDRFRMPIR